MLNIIHNCRQVALLKRDDAVGHLRWGEPRVVPNDAHDGNVDVWKDVRWSAKNRERSKDQNEDSQHYECVRPLQRYSYNPHDWLSPIFRPAWPDCINQIHPMACASGSCYPGSRSIARLLEARRP